ncbi:MAG: YbaB/EbfC family nucleoid-associated protein [Nocardioidaceae bacterium]|nr:YbaB/EbfC family nucleoid-associated protein [Nocardioidaceae bacterium]
MTDNPFGNLDLGAMLEQAQQMQAQLVEAQEELAKQTVSGNAGGVSVTLSGTGEMTAVEVLPGTFDGGDADSLADLGDLVVAAYRDAKNKVDAITAATLGPLAGGLGGGDLGDLGGTFGLGG